MTERVLNLVTYIQWEKPQVIEYDKICNGLKALSETLSIYSYIIMVFSSSVMTVGVKRANPYRYWKSCGHPIIFGLIPLIFISAHAASQYLRR